MSNHARQRRQLIKAALGVSTAAVFTLAMPALAQSVRLRLPEVSEGPFYPPKPWRALQNDWDADLTRVRNGGQTLIAQGEHLGLDLRVVDAAGKAVDRVEFEIWQCDVNAVYRHPSERAWKAERKALTPTLEDLVPKLIARREGTRREPRRSIRLLAGLLHGACERE